MKAESSSTTNVSIGDIDDELLTITEENNKEVVESSSCESCTSIWILDFRCSYHVCSNKMMFDTNEAKKASKSMLGDKQHVIFWHREIVRIRMQVGVVWSLGKVRFVPPLRKNMISLGTLDREGYSYRAHES